MDLDIRDPCLSNFSCPRETIYSLLVALTPRLDSRGKPEKKVVCCYLREELCAQTLGTGMAKICIAVNTEVTILLTE